MNFIVKINKIYSRTILIDNRMRFPRVHYTSKQNPQSRTNTVNKIIHSWTFLVKMINIRIEHFNNKINGASILTNKILRMGVAIMTRRTKMKIAKRTCLTITRIRNNFRDTTKIILIIREGWLI